MEHKIVYVPVSVEDELPPLDIAFYCTYKGQMDVAYNDSEDGIPEYITEWLKPTSLSELLKEKPSTGDEQIEKLAAQLLKEKDEQIKELVDALDKLLDEHKKNHVWMNPIIRNAESILQKQKQNQ